MMKKLFAIAVAASLFSGLYAGASFGLGGMYTISGPSNVHPDSNYSYPSIVADVMVDLLPIVGVRMGIVSVDIKSDSAPAEGGVDMAFGTGVYGDVVFKIPMAGMVSPYIPIGVWYYNNYHGYEDLGLIGLKGGVGAMMGFGGVSAYLEGGVRLASFSYPEVWQLEDKSYTYFYVQGGIRVPIPSM
jgi:hypothetical protein